MSDDLLITPGSRKLEIVDTAGNVDAKIETDASGNLKITNAGGDIEIGDTSSDVYIGDGTNSVDIVFEQDGSIRGTSGVVLTLGASGSSVVMATDLSLGGNDLTNIGDLTVTGNLNITGDINSASVTDLDVVDKTITVGVGQNEASSGGSGLIIAGSNAQMLWDEGDNRFEFNKNVYTTGQWQGNGSGLTTLNASNISSGTIADARLTSRVFLGNNNGTISGGNSQSFDDKTANGIHYVSNWTSGAGTTNGPSHEGNAYGWGMLRVTQFIDDANYVVQEYIPHNDDGAFIRVKWNGTWGPWRQSWTSRSDGANSGLDADKLDGQQGSYYLDYSNFTNTPTIPNVSLYLPLAGGTMSGTLNMGANNITMTNSNITGVNSITINDPGEGIIFTGTNTVSLYAEDDASDNIMKFHNAAALKIGNNHVATSTETTANINSNGTSSTAFVTIYTVNGNDLGSSIRLTGKGTTGNVVVNFVADIVVNHSGDIYIQSMSGAYTQVEIKITSTNNEDFAIEIRRSDTQTTQANLKFTCAPLSRSTFITAASSHSFTGASLTHLTNAGTNQTSTGGTYQNKSSHNATMPNITLGAQITHDGDTDTYIKFDTNRVRIVDGGGTYLDTNNGTAVLHTSTTFAGDVTGTFGAMVVGNDSHTHSFNNLTGKASGTGEYSTSGYLQAGRGSGGVALTHNDGHGNANVTFNHKAGVPEQNGASLRIETNTDTSGAGIFQFETSTGAVTSGTEVTLTSGMNVSHNYVEIPYHLRHTGNTSNYIQFETDIQKFFTDTTQRLRVDNGGVTINSGTLDMSANNIENVTDIYLADQIIHQGDTNTYMQFHNADEWRVVTGGAERLEVNNTSTKTTGGYFESATMASDKKYRWLRTSGNTYSLEHDSGSWYFYNETATRADLKFLNSGTIQIGNGTFEVNSNDKVYHTVNSVGIGTAYGQHVIEATDAQLDLVSSNAGTWGSSLNLVEGAGASNANIWSIARKTASGGNSLNFNFGATNQHDNAVKAVLESSGDLTLTGKLTVNKASADQQSNADTATIPATTGAEIARFHGSYTTGQYATEFAIVDRTGGLPLYVRQSLGTANSFENIARFGYHAKAEGSSKFAVFGSMQVKDGDLKMYGNVNLYEEDETGANSVHLPRGGYLSLYGNGSLDHSISSRNSAINATDDIRISSYGSVYINLDSNSNNTSTANFVIARHNTATALLEVDGETGAGKGLHSYPNGNADGVSLSSYAQGTVPINQGVVQIRSVGKTGWDTGDELGSIDWYNNDGSGVGARNLARMVAVNSQGNGSSTTTFNGELHFYTSAYNAQLNAAPVMRLTESNSVIIGDGTDASSHLEIRPADDGTADDIQFYNGSTRMGEVGTQDTTWLRINQSTAKNIYTPRYIRADSGFFVDDTNKGINGSGNFIGGTITGASDANVSNWDTAYTYSQVGHLPLAGGTLTGTLNISATTNARDTKISAGYHLQRSDHHSGHLEGSYNNVGGNSTNTNPIYTIGSDYNPESTTLGNMYGIGFSKNTASFMTGDLDVGNNSGWGLYVAADGDARIFLNASNGIINSTGEHYANGNRVFHDAYHPNADTWTTARSHTVTLTGEVTGTATQSVNGSGDKTWSIATTLGNTALNDQYIKRGTPSLTGNITTIASSSDIIRWNNVTTGRPASGQSNEYGPMLQMAYDGSNVSQLAHDFDQGNLYFRQLNTSTDTGTTWEQIFHDTYHPNADKWTTARSHTVTLTGQVTGTATQSVDGTGNKTWSISTSINNSSLDDQYVQILPRHNADGDSLVVTSRASITIWDVSGASDAPSSASDGLVLSAGWDSVNWGIQQYHDFHSNDLYLRAKNNGSMTSWERVFHDTYHPNADKWTSSRTLTLGGDLSGSVSFDGSAGFTLTATVADDSHNHIISNVDGLQTALDAKLPKAGGELTGSLTIDVDNQAGGALRIEANQTNPSQDFYFAEEIYSTLSGSQTFSGDKHQGGIYMDINSTATGGDTSQEHRVYGIYADVDSTGDADLVYGVYADATATPTTGQTSNVFGGYFKAEDNGGAGAVTTLYGVQGIAFSDNATSDVNAMYAGYFKTYNAADSAAIPVARAVYGEVEITTGSGDIYGNTYVFESQYDNNTTTAPTHTAALYYGNYAGTLPTTALGVYIVDAVPNSFAGSVRTGLGTTAMSAYGFIGDLNTGMYSPANHELGFTTNGGQRLKLDANGATVTGNITVSGTVDGRDIATDGAKLDNIAANATANVGDITAVTAGTGMTGGGTSGSVTLNVIGGDGITANADDIAVDSTVVRTSGTQTIGGAKTFSDGTIYMAGNLAHSGDTNTYMGFHAADQWRVVTGGAERLEVNNSYVTVAPTLSVADKIMHTGDTDTYMSFDAADQWKLYCGGYKMIQATEASSGYDYISFGGTDNSGEIFFNINGGDGHFDGDVYAFSTTTSSDRKLKKNIQSLEGSLEKVLGLRGVSFEWKKNNKKSIGFIAQEVQEVVPDLVKNNRKEHDGVLVDEHLGVDYGNVTALLVEAMKEQQQIINKLEARLKALETGEK